MISNITRLILAICLLCVFAFSATGCSLLDLPKQEPLTPLEKEQAERIYELSQHMHALLDKKYPDEGFDEGGPRSYDEQHLEFFFTAKKTKLTFVLRYEGDYLSEELPDDIRGRFIDSYAYKVVYDLYAEYINEISTKYFSGTVAQFECYPSFFNTVNGTYMGALPEKGSGKWNS